MADTLLDVLADARTALMALGPPVFLAADQDPAGEQPEVIVLDRVSDTRIPTYGLGAISTKRVQVTCYAPTLARALDLTTQAAAALAPLGLRFIQSRPAPDPDFIGQISEYRR
ncbi:hypothetical protein [Deinococcus daejeonensis]|uniref:DUF3168 domain-containing protein n=1 Tax=Deinococcus daejeonensis TaxID=1007098 RepID=A0ABQ2IVI2_9DEIO|nr:hypothetical protein [Deinococcus daejeonensis]GGN32265.1 hypothetical protein GCM10010842_08800 [Deinococcus daejeonensis]